jgi:PAS domain S-box-containing protein
MILHTQSTSTARDPALALLDAVPAPMWIVDRETLRFLAVNPYAVRQYGYSEAEFLQMSVTDIRPAEDVQHPPRAVSRHYTGFTDAGMFRHRWRDGRVRDVTVRGYDIVYDSRPATLILVEDITERLEAERTHTLLQAAMAQVDDAVALVRLDDAQVPRVVFVNAAAERLFGFARGEMASGEWAAHPLMQRNARAWRRLRRVLRGAQAQHLEISWQIDEETVRRLDVMLAPVFLGDESRPRHWTLVARDVTAQREAAERSALSQRLESLGLLAGSIAHDFSNVVHVIAGYAELARKRLEAMPRAVTATPPITGDALSAIRGIQDTAERAAGLSRQLLAFSRRQQLSPSRVDLHELLPRLRDVLDRLAGERVKVSVEPPSQQPGVLPGAPAIVWVDPVQIERVLMNLVVNARDAQPEGGAVRIHVDVIDRAHIPDAAQVARTVSRVVRLCVSDDGPGIPPDLRERVFDPFFTTKSHGTGLGLSTVHGVVRQSGGDVFLHSPPGKGLTVEIFLPQRDDG